MAYCGLGPILRAVRNEKEADSDDEAAREARSEALIAEGFRRSAVPKTVNRKNKQKVKGEPQREAKQIASEASARTAEKGTASNEAGKVRMSKAERKKAKKTNETPPPNVTDTRQ